MELLTQLLQALWAQDFETLANPSMIGMLYFVLFVILFLENGLLPAAFLPGDSLLVLVGVLIAKGAMGYPQTILLLTVAASLGCWVSYIQGRWLGNTRTVQNWLSHLPAHYHQRAHHLFHKHGLSALLIGRFIAFVRTLLPTIAGLSGLNNARFQFFNWRSDMRGICIPYPRFPYFFFHNTTREPARPNTSSTTGSSIRHDISWSSYFKNTGVLPSM